MRVSQRAGLFAGVQSGRPAEARYHHSEADQRIREYAMPAMDARDNQVRADLKAYVDARTAPEPKTSLYLRRFILPVGNAVYQFDAPPPSPALNQQVAVEYTDASNTRKTYIGRVVRIEQTYKTAPHPGGGRMAVFSDLVFVEAQTGARDDFDLDRYVEEQVA